MPAIGDESRHDGPATLAAFFAEHLPLAGAMGVRVDEATPRQVSLRVPLSPNLNHHGTAFGGSISAAGILAGWSLLHLRLLDAGLPEAAVVVGDSRTRFRRPVEADFSVVCEYGDEAGWAEFLGDLRTLGRGRVTLRTTLIVPGQARPAAVHEGLFVATLARDAKAADDGAT